MSVELPEPAEAGAVKNLQRALLRAIQDQLQDSLDDEDAAAALVGSATLATSVATRSNGVGARNTYKYTLTAWVPVALAGRALGGGGRRRVLVAGAIPAALDGLPQSGYFLQRLHELGFDVDALASSGALGVSGGVVAPPSASPSPAGAATISLRLSGLPAGAFVAGNGALTTDAVDKIAAGLAAGVATACPACIARVLRVEDSAGAPLYAAARRLGAQGAVTVFGTIYGPGALTAQGGFDEGAASARLTTLFGTAVTASVVGTSGGGSAAVASAALTPAAALGIAAAALALLLASAYGVYRYCAWERRAAKLKRGAGDDGGAPGASIARAGGVVLHLREEAGAALLSSPTSISAASGRGFGEGAAGGAPLAKQSIYADFDELAPRDACVCCPPPAPFLALPTQWALSM